jgi:ADP-heptose:LPS heptosyltransferase
MEMKKKSSVHLRRSFDTARRTLWLAIDALVSLIPVKTRRDRVLVVRLDAIGDFVLWLGAAQVIAKAYKAKGSWTILIADPAWADWANDLQLFDQVIPLDRRIYDRNVLYRIERAAKIRRLGCSTAIEPTYSRTYYPGDSIIRTCGAQERIGFGCDPGNCASRERRMSDRWYTKLIPASAAPLTELERNTEFVNGLLGTDDELLLPDLRSLGPPHPLKEFWKEVDPSKPYYVLSPGAAWGGKRWQVSSFRGIAERLYAQTGWQGIVCGGPADVALGAELCSGKDISLVNFVGRTSLPELASIISHARLVLTNDTSAVHIAAAARVPSICVLGGGHFGRFLPYQIGHQTSVTEPQVVIHKMPCFNCDWNCVYDVPRGSPFPCIAEVTVDNVWQAVERALEMETAKIPQYESGAGQRKALPE